MLKICVPSLSDCMGIKKRRKRERDEEFYNLTIQRNYHPFLYLYTKHSQIQLISGFVLISTKPKTFVGASFIACITSWWGDE